MDQTHKFKKILLTGGGTGGSVVPLLAIVNEIRRRGELQSISTADFNFLWLGTKTGIERHMVEEKEIEFRAISACKIRRYFSWQNFIDLFKIKLAFWQSFFVIMKWKPDLVISAGSFVSVPVVWAAWALRVPILIHQQDLKPGLANKLMVPFAKVIMVTFDKSLADFGKKAVLTGSPIREEFLILKEEDKYYKIFNIKNNLPLIIIIGGGTGAQAINELVGQCLGELTKYYKVIHLTGKNKMISSGFRFPNYSSFEFLGPKRLAFALNHADIVISRCGMGVLTELSYLGKPSILIPLPNSHQEENANIFKEKEAVIVLDQDKLTKEKLIKSIRALLSDEILRRKLSNNIKNVIKKGANKKIVEIINGLVKEKTNGFK